ncbi:MAG TPA: PP2C family protein-serine/threonine phosphatase [Candidatus Sulfotelmatobacter sp.]|nr:PP2C family protein-serine/threonine phosphatase [Candidatus Sulfotelmatobacter sp.]
MEHLFPPQFLRLPGMEIALAYRHAGNREHVGGDIIDVYRLLDGQTVLSIADISGKGVKAAVDAALVKYSMRAYASEGFSPDRILRSLNRLYIEKNINDGEESFVTAFVAAFDPATGVLRYASAAHDPIAIREPGRPAYELPVTAPLLALFDDPAELFGEARLTVESNTLLVAATDGLTESRGPGGEFFGLERLLRLIDANCDKDAEGVLAAVLSEVRSFSRVEFEDDTAILVARFI